MKTKNWILMLMSATFTALLFVGVALAQSTIVVTPSDLEDSKSEAQTNEKWFFYNDENDIIDNTLGSFVIGPATPAGGVGSAEISVSGTQRRNIATYQFRGVPLADITTLAFSTYNPSAGNGGGATRSAYLNFNVDFDGSDSWQQRLVYVPSKNGSVAQNEWQEWDTIEGGDALWWWSGYAGNGNQWPDGNTNQYRTWGDIVASFPGVSIRATDGWLGLRVGEPYINGYTENIDTFKFGTASGTTVFDFEPYKVASNKNACKNGGWRNIVRADGSAFKNQGDCIQYVNTGK